MAGFRNGTIAAFSCSDSARVDGHGRWWTNGREKKTHFHIAVVGSALSLFACSLVSQSHIRQCGAFCPFDIAARDLESMCKPKYKSPCARLGIAIEIDREEVA